MIDNNSTSQEHAVLTVGDPNKNTSTKPVINVLNLSKHYPPQIKAVDNISFQVYEGEIFGFLGPNGAGKTTTISILTTLLRPTSGTAEVAGYDITKNASKVRKAIGVVQQNNTTDRHMTGRENLIFTARLQGIPNRLAENRATELLNLVELSDAVNRKVETYSGGMRRRLEVACGLMIMPKVLFLDEPTLGLDVQTRTAIWNYIKKLNEERSMTLFLTTHYMEEADSLCDRIAIIDHGQIITYGSSAELKSKLGDDTIELGVRGAEKDLSQVIGNLPMVKKVTKEGSVYRIKAENGEEAALAVIEAVKSQGYFVNRILVNKPSLSEVYLELTGRAFREDEPGKESRHFFGRNLSL